MSLPKQVQDQLEEAERIDAEIAASQEPQEPQPIAVPDIVQDPAPAAPVAETAPPKSAEPDVWEQRFKTLKGKYDSEVPRLTAQLKGLETQVQALLKAQETAATPPPPPPKLVTDKDAEAYGADLIDVMRRQALEVAQVTATDEQARRQADRDALTKQLDTVAERQELTDRRLFFADLGRLVPDYETVNNDQGFLDWLADVDTLSGVTRQDYLNSAVQNHDVSRTAQLFNAYKLTTTTSPAPTPPVDTRQQLERQVAPGTSKASSPATSDASTKVWSMAEIDNFYRQCQRGDFIGKDTERARVEQEIDMAVAQGRLRP